jgi:hypothetical protein
MHYEIKHYIFANEQCTFCTSRVYLRFTKDDHIISNKLRSLKHIIHFPPDTATDYYYQDDDILLDDNYNDIELSNDEINMLVDCIPYRCGHHFNRVYVKTLLYLVINEESRFIVWQNNPGIDIKSIVEEHNQIRINGINLNKFTLDAPYGNIIDPSLIGLQLIGCDHDSTRISRNAGEGLRKYLWGHSILAEPLSLYFT